MIVPSLISRHHKNKLFCIYQAIIW